jgi:TPR repeat protein
MYNLFKKNKESYGDALIYYFSSQPESSSIYENLLLQRIYKLKDLSQSKIASIFKCIQPLAKDQSRAQALLGYFYLKGIGTKKNAAQAVELFKMASKHQEPLAQWGLGEAFEYGTGGITKDMKEAVKMYTLASKQNLVLAHYELAIQHENGEVIEKDLPLANYYYTLAADEEFPPSQNNLAYNFEYGIGLTSNKEKALELYTLSANQGYPAACYNLGLLKKSLEAFKLFKKAAMKGHVKAQLEVSEMYRKGEGVKKNKTKANKFLALANSSK